MMPGNGFGSQFLMQQMARDRIAAQAAAQKQATERAERQAAAQKAEADRVAAAQQAAAAEAARQEEATRQREQLLVDALAEIRDPNTQAARIKEILLKTTAGPDLELKNRFLATNPLKTSIVRNALEAVRALIDSGVTMDNWQEYAEPSTPIYEILHSKFQTEAHRVGMAP
jgi:hypothetical protein